MSGYNIFYKNLCLITCLVFGIYIILFSPRGCIIDTMDFVWYRLCGRCMDAGAHSGPEQPRYRLKYWTTRSSVCSFPRIAHSSLALLYLLHLCTLLRSLVCSLTYFTHPLAHGTVSAYAIVSSDEIFCVLGSHKTRTFAYYMNLTSYRTAQISFVCFFLRIRDDFKVRIRIQQTRKTTKIMSKMFYWNLMTDGSFVTLLQRSIIC